MVISFAVSGFFGGWDNVPKPVPTIKVNESVDCGPWKVTVTGARLLADLPKDGPRPVALKDKAGHWLVVVVTLENQTSEPWGLLSEVVALPGQKEKGQPIQVRSVYMPKTLNPGMPESIAYFWEEPAGKVSVQVEKVVLVKRTLREDRLSTTMEWRDPEPCAEVHNVPVVDKRDAA